MAYFSGNFLHRTAIMLQWRSFMIPWSVLLRSLIYQFWRIDQMLFEKLRIFRRSFCNNVAYSNGYFLILKDLLSWLKRNNVVIYCANGRGCSSSSLVNYIPRKAIKNKTNEGSSLAAWPLEERSIGRFHISNEFGRSFSDVDSDSDDEILPSVVNSLEGKINFMAVTDEIFEDPDKVVEENNKMCCGIPSGRSWQDVQNSAIKLLASRAFTAVELKKKLQGKNFQHETIDAVITDFKSRGLINDCLYAEAYARSRWSSSSWGPRRIRQALLRKGVSEADAEKAIKLVFKNNEGDEDEDEDEESGISMSKVCMDELYVEASKQWQRSNGASQETRKSRIVRWLQYRGFNWDVIKYMLKKLESGSPS